MVGSLEGKPWCIGNIMDRVYELKWLALDLGTGE